MHFRSTIRLSEPFALASSSSACFTAPGCFSSDEPVTDGRIGASSLRSPLGSSFSRQTTGRPQQGATMHTLHNLINSNKLQRTLQNLFCCVVQSYSQAAPQLRMIALHI